MSEFNNIVRCAVEDFTKAFQRIHGNTPVMLEIVNGSRIDTMLCNKIVSRHAFFFHGSPERRITDHHITPRR